MKSKKYKVIRSRVYYGEVVVPHTIYELKDGKQGIYEYRPVRSMLFELKDNGYANDLLNRVNEYPVLNKQPLVEEEYGVLNAICLDDVLDYLGYLEELGYSDIKNVRDEIFSGHFASDNPEIFGLVEVHEDGRRKFKKSDDSLVDSYFLKKFDNLRKKTVGEVMFNGADCLDPFKAKREEKKKKLTLC